MNEKNQKVAEKIRSWQAGENGFYQWLEDIKPKVLTRSNRYEIFIPTAKQKKRIKQILKTDKAGQFAHSLSLNIEPRRHGKSTVFALIVLWFFTSRKNFTVQLLGSTEDHCRRVQFNTLKKIINNTDKLKRLIPESNQYSYTIVFPVLGNQIQYSASNTASAFGDKINLLWISDFHSFEDLGPFNALQAALLDSDDSFCFIDSNVDETGGHVHTLQNEAEADDTMFVNYTCYRHIEHYCKAAPEWIDRKKARRLEKTTLPVDFSRDILGKRTDAKNALFSADLIQNAKSRYRSPVNDIESLVQGRAYKIGGGLDRAKSLIAMGRGDYTVWTVVAKVANPNGEPEYYILNQHRFKVNAASNIKAVILEDHKRYKIDNMIMENYETADLHAWAIKEGIPCELISAHDNMQNASFPEMFRTFREGRFHFPESLTDFESELSTFSYTRRKNGLYAFGHSNEKFHDDTVYSTNWAIFSLRKEVLSLYELDSVVCVNKSKNRSACLLMGGNLELLCKDRCQAYHELKEMYQQFKNFQMDSDLSMPDFFSGYVKVSGCRIQQAV